LDELHLSEEDHSDALCPIQREAEVSLLGEHALVKAASTEELRLVRTSLSSDIQKVHNEVGRMQQSISTISRAFGSLLASPSTQCQGMFVIRLSHSTLPLTKLATQDLMPNPTNAGALTGAHAGQQQLTCRAIQPSAFQQHP
jgi:hypothetical protein